MYGESAHHVENQSILTLSVRNLIDGSELKLANWKKAGIGKPVVNID
jgi:hypothetical protein